MHNTLHEFVFHTESIGYLLSALILLAFIPFWRFLTERQGSE
jgi:hypothetical protein